MVAAAAVADAAAVAAAVVADAVVTAAAEEQNQDDDPPAAVITVRHTHKNTSKRIFSSGLPLIPWYSGGLKRCVEFLFLFIGGQCPATNAGGQVPADKRGTICRVEFGTP